MTQTEEDRKMKRLTMLMALVCVGCLFGNPVMGKQYVTIATGGTGGTYYPVGAAMSKILNNKVEGISTNAESTGGSVANCRLLGEKKVEFGFSATDALYAAYFSEREFEKSYKNLRLLFVGYGAPFHVLVGKKSNMKEIVDLKGKKVASYPGNTSEFQVPSILSVYGISRDDYTTVPLRPSEQVQAYRDGAVDVIFSTLGTPNSAIMDLTTTHDMRFLPIKGEEADQAIEKYPFFPKDVIEKGIYPGLDHDVQTLATKIVLITHKDVSDKLITAFMDVIANSQEELGQIHKAAATFKPEKIVDSVYIPLHPAAEKWYQSKGILNKPEVLWK